MTQLPDATWEPVVSAGEDDLRQYLQEIRQYPLLSAEEEREIAIRCAAGDEEAIAIMVNSNLRLVVSVAREYAGRGVALLDLIQEGNIGLLVAAQRFDYSLGYRFSTYATEWIRQGIYRCLVNHSRLIRVPGYTAAHLRRLSAARAELTGALDREPTPEELAKKLETTPERVRKLLQLVPETFSLDAPTGADGESTVGQLLQDRGVEPPLETVAKAEMHQTMSELLGQLPQRQQEVLRLHFGLEDGVCLSLEQIGKRMGISKERARQLQRQALDRLQKLGDAQGLGDFLE